MLVNIITNQNDNVGSLSHHRIQVLQVPFFDMDSPHYATPLCRWISNFRPTASFPEHAWAETL
jgi:hypothetical protein